MHLCWGVGQGVGDHPSFTALGDVGQQGPPGHSQTRRRGRRGGGTFPIDAAGTALRH